MGGEAAGAGGSDLFRVAELVAEGDDGGFDVAGFGENVGFEAGVADYPKVALGFTEAVLQDQGIGIELLLDCFEGGGFGVLEIGVGGVGRADGVFEVVALGVEGGDGLGQCGDLGDVVARLAGEFDELGFLGVDRLV